jgi:hypothetical protein
MGTQIDPVERHSGSATIAGLKAENLQLRRKLVAALAFYEGGSDDTAEHTHSILEGLSSLPG